MNRPSTVKDNRLAAGTTTYAYDLVGNLSGYQYPNGVQSTYTYNALNRLTNVRIANGGGAIASYAYTLGPSGNRTAAAEFGGRQVNYTYDALYRLTGETISGSADATKNGSVGYTYDPEGNRLQRTSTLAPIPASSYTYDANDRLTTDTYDSNGNTTTSGGSTYGYDFENHLLTQNAGAVSIVYDGDGNRVAKTASGSTTQYLVDDRNLTGYAQVLEELSGGTVQRVYTYGLNRISQSQASGTSFYGYDGHGNVRMLTDATGAVTDRYDYDAFGNVLSQTGTTSNVYLYSGEQADLNLGFYYLRARYLNTSTGRFQTEDVIEGWPFELATLHRYSYTANKPTNAIDPSGFLTLEELRFSNIIQGILQLQKPVNAVYAFKRANEKLSIALGVVEIAYSLLQPQRTEAGLEWTLNFRDPLDHRVRDTIKFACSSVATSGDFCDKLDVTFKPRAGLSGEFTVGWDFKTNTFTSSLLTPSIDFDLVQTSIGDLTLKAEVDLVRQKLRLNFKRRFPSIRSRTEPRPQNDQGGSCLRDARRDGSRISALSGGTEIRTAQDAGEGGVIN